IIFTTDPPRMRVFDVFIHKENILSELDIYACVGANMPLVRMDALVNVIDGGNLTIRFEAIIGSPIVSAICIRKTPHFGAKMNRQSHTFIEEDSRKTDQVNELIVGKEDCNQKCRGRNCKSALKCCPLSADAVAAGAVSITDFEATKDGELNIQANGAPKKVFKFDSVFTLQDNQVDVTLQLSLFQFWMATMFACLHSDKLELGRQLQWRE
ncbi:hypothetical protein KI387_030554, partial [Taxus chinensis]